MLILMLIIQEGSPQLSKRDQRARGEPPEELLKRLAGDDNNTATSNTTINI